MIDKDVINRILRDFPMFHYNAMLDAFQHRYGPFNGFAAVRLCPASRMWRAELSFTPQTKHPDFVPAEFDTPEQALGYLLLQGAIYE